jgi:hypothetical protein
MVKEAAHLLVIVLPSSLYSRPNDSGIRSDVIKSVTHPDIVQKILRWSHEGRVHLVRPTLGSPEPRHPDVGEDWGIGPWMFERIKNALANGGDPAVLPEPAVIDATVPPNEGGPGEAGSSAAASGVAPQNAKKSDKLGPPIPEPAVIEAAALPIDSGDGAAESSAAAVDIDRTAGDRLIEVTPDPTTVATDEPSKRHRGKYQGPLDGWLAQQPLSELRKRDTIKLAKAFRLYCEQERPDVLLLLPKRDRSMLTAIEVHIRHGERAEAAQKRKSQ